LHLVGFLSSRFTHDARSQEHKALMYNSAKSLRPMARRICASLADSNAASNLYPLLLHFPSLGLENVSYKVIILPISTPSMTQSVFTKLIRQITPLLLSQFQTSDVLKFEVIKWRAHKLLR